MTNPIDPRPQFNYRTTKEQLESFDKVHAWYKKLGTKSKTAVLHALIAEKLATIADSIDTQE